VLQYAVQFFLIVGVVLGVILAIGGHDLPIIGNLAKRICKELKSVVTTSKSSDEAKPLDAEKID
jgi:hypothetical protein